MASAAEWLRFIGTILAFLSLGLVPIAAGRWARRRCPRWRHMVIGIGAGAVAAPFSMGMYLTFGIPFLGFVPGMIGLILVMIHGAPGFHLATALVLRAPFVVVYWIE